MFLRGKWWLQLVIVLDAGILEFLSNMIGHLKLQNHLRLKS